MRPDVVKFAEAFDGGCWNRELGAGRQRMTEVAKSSVRSTRSLQLLGC